jgi:hypothetical protein
MIEEKSFHKAVNECKYTNESYVCKLGFALIQSVKNNKFYKVEKKGEAIIIIKYHMGVRFNSKKYEIPLLIHFGKEVPQKPPEIFLQKTEDIAVNPKNTNIHPNTFQISTPTLTNWTAETNLSDVFKQIRESFSIKFPIYKISKTTKYENKSELSQKSSENKKNIQIGFSYVNSNCNSIANSQIICDSSQVLNSTQYINNYEFGNNYLPGESIISKGSVVIGSACSNDTSFHLLRGEEGNKFNEADLDGHRQRALAHTVYESAEEKLRKNMSAVGDKLYTNSQQTPDEDTPKPEIENNLNVETTEISQDTKEENDSNYKESEANIIKNTIIISQILDNRDAGIENEIKQMLIEEIKPKVISILKDENKKLNQMCNVLNNYKKEFESQISLYYEKINTYNNFDIMINKIDKEIKYITNDIFLLENEIKTPKPMDKKYEINTMGEKLIKIISIESTIEDILLVAKKAVEREVFTIEQSLKIYRSLSRELFKVKVYRDLLLNKFNI